LKNSRISVQVTAEMFVAVSKETDVLSQASVVRMAIKQFLDKRKNSKNFELYEKCRGSRTEYSSELVATVREDMYDELLKWEKTVPVSSLTRVALTEYLKLEPIDYILLERPLQRGLLLQNDQKYKWTEEK
jgi:hypothetical protein